MGVLIIQENVTHTIKFFLRNPAFTSGMSTSLRIKVYSSFSTECQLFITNLAVLILECVVHKPQKKKKKQAKTKKMILSFIIAIMCIKPDILNLLFDSHVDG